MPEQPFCHEGATATAIAEEATTGGQHRLERPRRDNTAGRRSAHRLADFTTRTSDAHAGESATRRAGFGDATAARAGVQQHTGADRTSGQRASDSESEQKGSIRQAQDA